MKLTKEELRFLAEAKQRNKSKIHRTYKTPPHQRYILAGVRDVSYLLKAIQEILRHCEIVEAIRSRQYKLLKSFVPSSRKNTRDWDVYRLLKIFRLRFQRGA